VVYESSLKHFASKEARWSVIPTSCYFRDLPNELVLSIWPSADCVENSTGQSGPVFGFRGAPVGVAMLG
jgi:hypothetical protein